MKRVLTVMLLLLAAVGSGAFCRSRKNKNDSRKFKVQLITMDQMDQHWANIDKGAKKAAAELGNIKYKWNSPAVKDDAQQIECINNAVAQGADAILLAANGPDAVTSTLREATAAGVKIIYVDSAANYPGEATFSTDNTAAGKIAGQKMLAKLKVKGIHSGTIGIISVNTATASTVARDKGFRSAFAGTKYVLFETQQCDGDAARAKDAAANFITQGVVGLFGTNEGSTVGIGNAIHESGLKIIGVGFDKSDMIQQLINEGYLFCSIVQNPYIMGYEGMKAAEAVLTGRNIVNRNVDTGVSVLIKSGF